MELSYELAIKSKSLFSFFYFKDFIYFIFREGKKRQCVVASQYPLVRTWTTTQACALTWNQTGDPLVCRTELNPLNHTS